MVNSVPYKKPKIADIYDFLLNEKSLIVHFSGCPKGTGWAREDNLFPNDLLFVINDMAMGGVSCSAIKIGDSFAFENPRRNAIGSVGVVLGLKSEQSLVIGWHKDLGSGADEVGSRSEFDRDLSITDLSHSFSLRDGYNEWVLRDYTVLGIFVSDDVIMITEKKYPDEYHKMPEEAKKYLNGPMEMPSSISLSEVAEFFPNLPIYTFKEKHICRLIDGKFEEVAHSLIYKR